MSKVFVSDINLSNIADAIRAKNGAQTQYYPREMAAAIMALDIEEHKPIQVNIQQSEHQTIKVKVKQKELNNTTINANIELPETIQLEATVVADEGYTPGTLDTTPALVNVQWGDTVIYSATAAEEETIEEPIPSINGVRTFYIIQPAASYTFIGSGVQEQWVGFVNANDYPSGFDTPTVTSGIGFMTTNLNNNPSFISSAYLRNGHLESFVMKLVDRNTFTQAELNIIDRIVASSYVSIYRYIASNNALSELAQNVNVLDNTVTYDGTSILASYTQTAFVNQEDTVLILFSESPMTQQEVKNYFDNQMGD